MNDTPEIRIPVGAKQMNVNGHAFGGWIFSQMDHAACLIGERLTKGMVTSVAVNDLVFKQPVLCGERVSVFCRNVRRGRTSLQLDLEVISEKQSESREKLAATATFVVVAIDEQGRPRTLP